MKKHLFSFGTMVLVLAAFTTGCSWFESGNTDPEDSFYRPMNRAGKNAGHNAGNAEFEHGGNGAFGNANQPSPYASGSGLDSSTYDGFGTPIPGVTFEAVYFEFDQSRINSSEMNKISNVVSYLNGNPGTGVVVEGNCDNRGSEEYNRALGERRAISAQEQILAAGIAPNRIKTISNGKSKPVANGENEEAYRMNRRDDFIAVKLLHP